MQRARLNHVEIGNQRAQNLLAFNAADQVLRNGMFQKHDGSARFFGVFDQHVDFVAAQRALGFLLVHHVDGLFVAVFGILRPGGILVVVQKHGHVVDDVLIHIFEVFFHAVGGAVLAL